MKRVGALAGVAVLLSMLTWNVPVSAASAVPCSKLYERELVKGTIYTCVTVYKDGKYVAQRDAGLKCKTVGLQVLVGTTTYACTRVKSALAWKKASVSTYPTLSLNKGLTVVQGGDADVVEVNGEVKGWQTGNGTSIGKTDAVADTYMSILASPTLVGNMRGRGHIQLSITYLDEGTDQLWFQYDAANGPWSGGATISKTNTGKLKTSSFNICDAGLQHRQNGGDIRIADLGDGREVVSDVTIKFLPTVTRTWWVDRHGANPFDNAADSDAIQTVLNSTCSGDTVVFTSGQVGASGYQGYLIDKTVRWVGDSVKSNMTFTSSTANDHAAFRATPGLLGFVAMLYGKGTVNPSSAGKIDAITLQRIDFDAARAVRRCSGADGIADGRDDNWGSVDPGDLMEPGNPGTHAGGIRMDGGSDHTDASQNYSSNPDLWSTDIVIQDVNITNVECGTALSFIESARSVIQRVTVRDAGDHHHRGEKCEPIDPDGESMGYADGLTVGGPDLVVRDNRIINPSDVGIAIFGGKNQRYLNNVVETTEGSYGAFAGISSVPDAYGDSSDTLIQGNSVINNSSTTCGGIHIGINVNPQAFHGGCVKINDGTHYGSEWSGTSRQSDGCTYTELMSKPVKGLCPVNSWCLSWAYADVGRPIVIKDNLVTGAHVNYSVGFVHGPVEESNNKSFTPRQTDFREAAACQGAPITPIDKVAMFPSLPGWTVYGLTCWD